MKFYVVYDGINYSSQGDFGKTVKPLNLIKIRKKISNRSTNNTFAYKNAYKNLYYYCGVNS